MLFAARRLPRLLALAATISLLGVVLLLVGGGPAAAQAQATAEIDGTAANKWEPATVTIKPGGTVTFKISGGPPHPVKSGTVQSAPNGDDKFDTSDCGPDKMAKVGATCTVKIAKAGTYPYFCQVHYSLGMTGTITVGAGGGGAAAATTTTAGGSVVAPPSAAPPPPAGRPAIYWAGWGLFAAGALLALVLIGLYVRFAPGFNRDKR
jgi:plastocyanin